MFDTVVASRAALLVRRTAGATCRWYEARCAAAALLLRGARLEAAARSCPHPSARRAISAAAASSCAARRLLNL